MTESSRFRSLEGILAKPPSRRPPLRALDTHNEPAPDAPAPDPAPPTAERAPSTATAPTPAKAPAAAAVSPAAKATKDGARGTAPASQATGGARRVAFRLEESLARALSERVTHDGTSQAHVVLDAIEAAHGAGTLTDLVQAQKRPAGAGGALFARPAVRGAASASVATEIRLDAGSLAVLDDLVTSTGADTRTQLIVAALLSHLR